MTNLSVWPSENSFLPKASFLIKKLSCSGGQPSALLRLVAKKYVNINMLGLQAGAALVQYSNNTHAFLGREFYSQWL